MTAQDQGGTYARALQELRRGRKASHWMWFVFPQLAGLGQSTTARHFALSSLEEARAYLQHPVLGLRLRECAAVIATLEAGTAEDVLGGIDALKLRSSMTLFQRVAPDYPVFDAVLDRYFGGQSDATTDRLLGS